MTMHSFKILICTILISGFLHAKPGEVNSRGATQSVFTVDNFRWAASTTLGTWSAYKFFLIGPWALLPYATAVAIDVAYQTRFTNRSWSSIGRNLFETHKHGALALVAAYVSRSLAQHGQSAARSPQRQSTVEFINGRLENIVGEMPNNPNTNLFEGAIRAINNGEGFREPRIQKVLDSIASAMRIAQRPCPAEKNLLEMIASGNPLDPDIEAELRLIAYGVLY